jgi:hypothetical protein
MCRTSVPGFESRTFREEKPTAGLVAFLLELDFDF